MQDIFSEILRSHSPAIPKSFDYLDKFGERSKRVSSYNVLSNPTCCASCSDHDATMFRPARLLVIRSGVASAGSEYVVSREVKACLLAAASRSVEEGPFV